MKKITTIWSIVILLLAIMGLSGCNSVNEIIVTPKEGSVPVGFELQLKAETLFLTGLVIDVTSSDEITWSSSDESIASVDSKGLMTGIASGSVTVTASGNFNGTDFTDSATIEVTDAIVTSVIVEPKSAEIPAGFTKAFNANARLSDGQLLDVTDNVLTSWDSSNPSVATISDKGVVSGFWSGNTSITASIHGHSDHAQLEVNEATATSLTITPAQQSTPIGLTQTFSAVVTLSNGESIDVTGADGVTWTSSDTDIAVISNDPQSKGVALGVSWGSVEISASGSFNGQQVSDVATLEVTDEIVTSLEVIPQLQAIPIGMKVSYKALATLSSGEVIDVTSESAISWFSSDSDRASISNSRVDKGTATALALGKVGISAFGEINGVSVMDTATLEIVGAIAVDLNVLPKPQESLETPQIPVGYTKQFKAEVVMSDGSVKDVTEDDNLYWTSDNTFIASISSGPENKGLATAVDVGTSLVIAQLVQETGMLQDYSELTVTPLHTLSIKVTVGEYENVVQGENIRYIGYMNGVMGRHDVESGIDYLDNGNMQMIYIDGVEEKPLEERVFYFSQTGEEQISGALKYKVLFEWPDNSVSEGVLEWQFEQNHYKLVDSSAAEKLLSLGEGSVFRITVTNEDGF